MRSDSRAVFRSQKVVLSSQSEPVFSHVSVRLELLLDHTHVLYRVGVHSILLLHVGRHVTPSKRVLRLNVIVMLLLLLLDL